MTDISGNVRKKLPAANDFVLGINVEAFWMVFEKFVNKSAVFPGLGKDCLDGSQNMILPDFSQALIEEEIHVNPIAVFIHPATGYHAVEMDVELHIFSESMEDRNYSGGDFYPLELMLENVFDNGENLLRQKWDEAAVFPENGPQFICQGKDAVPMGAIKHLPYCFVCPFFSEPAPTGWA
jgi:hypothetical protein